MQSLFEYPVPNIPVGDFLEGVIDWLVDNASLFFDTLGAIIETVAGGIFESLLAVPPLIMIILISVLALVLVSRKAAPIVAIALIFILSLGLDYWEWTMETIALILVSTITCFIIGFPLGIWGAHSDRAMTIIEPFVDFMQAIPALAYIVPVVFLFSVGKAAGVVATILFALNPLVRLTTYGIRNISKEVIEAGRSFGATNRQILTKIELPLAMPSIALGINQTFLLSFAMLVIAGYIGAGGLGQPVVKSISRMMAPLAIEAGVSIVILAIVLDRLLRSVRRLI
ncbi:MAG: ABC transporter permease subunit [Archaeoglobaceae archaeon]